jgi:hypothetical protein
MVCMRCARRREKAQLKRGSYAAYTRIIAAMCGAYADLRGASRLHPGSHLRTHVVVRGWFTILESRKEKILHQACADTSSHKTVSVRVCP